MENIQIQQQEQEKKEEKKKKEILHCKKCGYTLNPADRFCPGCGEKVGGEERECRWCGAFTTKEVCPECGKRVIPQLCAKCGKETYFDPCEYCGQTSDSQLLAFMQRKPKAVNKLSESEAKKILENNYYNIEIYLDKEEALTNGITATPCFIVYRNEERLIIPGVFSAEEFEIALKDLSNGDLAGKTFV